MVEIFCKRGELMEPDESIEQHATKRAEEIADVEKDKSSPEGLFKGTFRPSPRMELLFDEADGIFRCPTCQHEDEGGAFCENCGTFIERGDGYSDLDEDHDLDLEELELDADQEFAAHGHFHHFMGGLPQFPFGGGHMAFHPPHNHRHFHDHDSLGSHSDSDLDSEDDEEGSLQDFVEHDEIDDEIVHPNIPITISDDESDEGGDVATSRRRARRQYRTRTISSTPSSPSVVTVSTDSENGDHHDETLRTAGWSPLETENESELEGQGGNYRGYESTEDGHNSEEESDTNTMRNDASDDDDSDDGDQTPNNPYHGMNHFNSRGYTESEDDHSEVEFPHGMDRDGDTEMSASPGPSSSIRGGSVSTDYGYDGEREVYGYDGQGTPRASRGESVSTDYEDMHEETLGVAHEIHQIEDDSSDEDVQPPSRRRPRQRYGNAQVQHIDPRISNMLANHQQMSLGVPSGFTDSDIEELVNIESRNRRVNAYRQPLRRADSLRSSRSPSATRLNSSSRVARPPRQYHRRF
jgi:hypothetical protein